MQQMQFITTSAQFFFLTLGLIITVNIKMSVVYNKYGA